LNVLRVASVFIALLLGACSAQEASETSSSSKKASSAQSTSSHVQKDPTGETFPLRGAWKVMREGTEKYVFNFQGQEASVRYPTKDNLEVFGSLARFGDNGLVITAKDGLRYIFRYVVEGEHVFIGRGESHRVPGKDSFSFPVTTKHRVFFDGTGCSLRKDEKILQTIECSWDDSVTPPVFTYDTPTPKMVGPKRVRRSYLVGKSLISQTLYGYRATPID
jgi:hypothetical protein